MKKYPGIDYNFRPKSYWKEETLEQAILKNVKGEFRRRRIRAALAGGDFSAIPEAILNESLSEELRLGIGRIHPGLMGGEYLPDHSHGEVEIVRISLDSTTNDIISLRARRLGRRIGYSIADEYQGEFEYSLAFEESARPLSLGQLVEFLDKSYQHDVPGGLILGYNAMNADDEEARQRLRDFTSVSSEFYPQLYEHCERVFEEWAAETD